MTFVDSDPDANQLYGRLDIKRALDERNIDQYVLYWGASTTAKLSGQVAIASYGKKGEDLTKQFSVNTTIPTGATHLLLYAKNGYGEQTTPTSVAISDSSVSGAVNGLTFADTDTTSGEISGTLYITKATTETSYVSYVVYWGTDKTTKASATPITTIAVTGGNLTYSIAANTTIPFSATHLLVYYNTGTESATPIATQIYDEKNSQATASGLSFGDASAAKGTISGPIILNKATSEATVNYYALYLGSSSTTKASATPLVTLTANGEDLSYQLPATEVTTAVTHLLAYGVNHNGESASPFALALTDLDLNTDLIAYFPFDANGLDASGNLRHGTLLGQPSTTTGRKGVPNQALYLSSKSGEYVSLGPGLHYRPTDKITFGGWFFKGNWSSGCQTAETMISNFETGGYRLFCEEGYVMAEVKLNDLYVTVKTPSSNLTGWSHLVASFDGRFFTLYLNGLQVARGDSTVTVPMQYAFENALFIGADPNGVASPEPNRYFLGKIDEVRIFNKELSAAEVLSLYNGEKP